MSAIIDVRAYPLNVPLHQPFGIANGSQAVATNVIVEVELDDGTLGLGEAAPFEAVSGETQASALSAMQVLRTQLLGLDAREYRRISALLWELAAHAPTVIAACETALLDALSRRGNLSLLHWFGGAQSTLYTDITIPTSDTPDPVESAASSARLAVEQGFTTLKVKVGKDNLETEARRVRAVVKAAPSCRLLLDANGGYQARDALWLLNELGETRSSIALFEQPVAREDWSGLIEVEVKGGIMVCADESFRDADDLARLVRLGGPGSVNIKTAKSGLVRGWDLAVAAKQHGFRMMIGGMVETELSMSASACLAGGLGGFEFVDLDTPLFMRERPLLGGFVQTGPQLELAQIGLGHGVSWIGPRN